MAVNTISVNYNPFETKVDKDQLMQNLNALDNNFFTNTFKKTQDPINFAFEALGEVSLKKLATDFVKESFEDIIDFLKGNN